MRAPHVYYYLTSCQLQYKHCQSKAQAQKRKKRNRENGQFSRKR